MVALGDTSIYEGDVGRRLARLPITVSKPLEHDAWFVVEPVDHEGKGATPGVDFKAVSRTVHLRAGTTAKAVTVPIFGDTTPELNEPLEMSIRPLDAPDVGFTDSLGVVGIIDDDAGEPAGPRVTVSTSRVYEGNNGARTVPVVLSLSEPQPSDVFITWSTDADTATPGVDFKNVSKTTRIKAGRTQKVVLIHITGDTIVEDSEDLHVVITGVSGGAGVSASGMPGILRIEDDDGDMDEDGLSDAAEDFYKSDPENPDTDGDLLTDYDEVVLAHTNPNQADTDGDGFDDLVELKLGSDPNDPDSQPSVDA